MVAKLHAVPPVNNDSPNEGADSSANSDIPSDANKELDLTVLANDEEAPPLEANVPQEVKDFVNRAHEFWQDNPKKWRRLILSSEKAVKEVKNMAAKYAKSTGRTLRESKQDNPLILRYKVTNVRSATTEESESESAQ